MMMPTSVVGTCKETAQNISDYMDGYTPFFKKARIRIHLGMCSRCRKWFRELQATFKGVEKVRSTELAIQMPPELRQKIETIFRS